MTAPVSNIKPPFAELLKASGVASTDDLARNHPAKLLRWMEEVNAEQRIVRQLPSLDMVSEWVHAAQRMPHLAA